MKQIIFCCIALFLLTACAKKVVICGLVGETMSSQKLASSVTINERYILADTSIVRVSGKIFGSYIRESRDTITEPLPFTNVMLTDLKTKKVFGKVTENDGSYELEVPASTYQLDIQFIGFNRIIIENVQLETGEIFNFSANLGQGIDKEYFEIKKHRTERKIIRKAN